MTDADVQLAIDEHQIRKVLMDWVYCRDNSHWDELRSYFHPEATIHISWISSTAEDFVQKSAGRIASMKPQEFIKHALGAARIRVNGNKASTECHAELVARVFIDGVLFDMVNWGRFLDMMEKRDDGVWRIVKRTMVYEKDRLDAVNPQELPDGFYESLNLDQFPHAYKHRRRLDRQTRWQHDAGYDLHGNRRGEGLACRASCLDCLILPKISGARDHSWPTRQVPHAKGWRFVATLFIERSQIRGEIIDRLGNHMGDDAFSLKLAFHPQQLRGQYCPAVTLHLVGPDD